MRLQLLNGFAEGGVGHIQRVRGAVKLPASTTRVKALRAENRSIIRFILVTGGHYPPREECFQIRPFFRLAGTITVLSIPGGRVREPGLFIL